MGHADGRPRPPRARRREPSPWLLEPGGEGGSASLDSVAEMGTICTAGLPATEPALPLLLADPPGPEQGRPELPSLRADDGPSWASVLPTAEEPAPAAGALRVISFNVLAPIWAALHFYPPGLDPALLQADARRRVLIERLQALAADTDVFCLQEVQASEFEAFARALGSDFAGAMSSNDPAYWANWVTPELGWQPNGCAIFYRRSLFLSDPTAEPTLRDIALSEDGNRALILEGTLRDGSSTRVRIASVHLDSDRGDRRLFEASSLLNQMPALVGLRDLICGDLNVDAITGCLRAPLERAGFRDALASLGNRENTHPWDTTYNGSAMWGVIDHILYRGLQPLQGDVLDGGVWSIDDETARIAETLRSIGSDHFPLTACLGL